ALVLFLSLAPTHFAQANIFSDIVNSIKNIPVSVPTLVVAIPLFIIASAIGLIFTLLSQVMVAFAQATMSIGVTPATQSIVQIGWSVSQQLANIFFILILAFIGLGTILRLQTYQLQKTLPALIMIALLVNFSGVLVGFVVDLGNLFTSFFLSQTSSFQNLGQNVLNLLENILDMVTAPGLEIVPKAAALIIQLVVQLIYFVIATAVVLIVMLLFFFRTVILWILAILAPIAFASYILPSTKKWWSQWWQQLIQWSIMGIPISFFLFLSSKLLAKIPLPGQGASPDMEWIDALKTVFGTTDLATVITSVIGNFVVLIMLAVGVMLSMQMAPAGAQAIINRAKGAGMRTIGWAGREGWRNVLKGKKIEKLGADIRQYGQRMEAQAADKKGFGKFAGKVSGFGIKAWGGGVELGSKGINANLRARDRAAVEAGQKLTGVDSQKGLAYIRAELAKPTMQDTSKIMGAFTQIIKNGDADDINKAIESGDIHRDLLPKLYKNAMDNGNVPEARLMAKAFLGRAIDKKDGNGKVIEKNELGVSEAEQTKILDKLSADDLKNMASDNLDPSTEIGQKALDTMMLKGDSQLVPQMLRMKKKQREAIWGHIQSKGAQWFVDNDREDILRWSASNAARGMGLGSIDNLTDGQVKAMIEKKGSELPTDKLRERMGRLQDDLKQIPSGAKGKDKNNILRQITQLQAEIDLRDEGKNSDASLSKKRGDIEGEIEKLNAVENKSDKDYEERAAKERELRPIIRELKRRGKLETPATLAAEPLSVQIAKLKEEENDLKERLPGLFGMARDQANKDLEEKSEKRKRLEKQMNSLPGYFAGSRLRDSEKEIGKIMEDIMAQEKSKNVAVEDIKRTRAQKGKVAPEKEPELVAREQRAQSLIDEANREIERLTQEKNREISDWQKYSATEEAKAPEKTIAADVIKLRERANETKQRLTRLKIAKAPLAEIQNIQKDLQEAQRNLRSEERNMATALREKKLRADLKIPHTTSEEAAIVSELNEISRGKDVIRSTIGKLDSELAEDEAKERENFIKRMEGYKESKKIGKEMEKLVKQRKKQL
ncbi:MAG: hypothetical protein HY443_00235, partial [Candidatus Nealsonbacteria bacterium]|nr:hypothetical protein [Candidatus Nealsonbacteria bacterium]